MGQHQYRPAVRSDIAECVALRALTRENAVSAERLASLGVTVESWGASVAAGDLLGHVCLDEGKIAGYAFGDRRNGEIAVVALLPTHEGRGIGKKLLAQVVSELCANGIRHLHLSCSSDPAHRSYGFYRHLGWKPSGSLDWRGDEILELYVASPKVTPNNSLDRTLDA